MATPSTQDIYRFRKQRGVNLGGWFVLEKWMAGSPFEGVKGDSDLDAAADPNAKEKLERHWDTFIQEHDWQWIKNHGFNTIRLPIGFYHLVGESPGILNGSDFESYADVYRGAWGRILNAIAKAEQYGLGVLVDLHAAAGGQNNDPHSGTGRGKANLWTPQNQITTTKALQILVQQLCEIQNVVGLELMNEPSNNDHLQAWYESIIDNLRGISNDLPIYISDAWDLNWYAPLVGKRRDFVVVDHHHYKCFTPDDHKLSGDEHAARMTKEIQPWLAKKSKEAKGSIVIGEWSAALNPASLRSKEAGEMDRQRRVFARAQLKTFEETCAGWFFWSYKHEKGWDAGWSLENATQAAIMPEWVGGKKRGNLASLVEDELGSAKKKALDGHTNYWASHPGQNFEHWRFDAGFVVGWEDAKHFMEASIGSSISELGFRGEWLKRRRLQHEVTKGSSEQLWEFEHGFDQGCDAARALYFSRG